MQDEQKVTTDNQEGTVDYIEVIKDLKENSVPKEKYQQLQEEHKRVLNSWVKGEQAKEQAKVEPVDVGQLRNGLFNKDGQKNLEYISKIVQLRNAIIENGGKDPFLPDGSMVTPTEEDIECANRVARIFQECIDYADGDSQVFTNELQRRTIDTAPKRR